MPLTADELEKEFASRTLHRGTVIVLGAADAVDLIERARIEGFPILGIDGFRLSGREIQPLLEHSVDLSARRHHKDTWAEATSFVQSRSGDVDAFEVVLDHTRITAA